MKSITGNQTTNIGSMPQNSIDDAFDMLSRNQLSIPSWPQFPMISFLEGMIPQCSEGFPGIKIDTDNKKFWVERDDNLVNQMTSFYEHVVNENNDIFAISEEYARGYHQFIRNLEKTGKKLPIIKGQVTGPFTFGLGLNDNNGKAVWFDDQYRDVVLKGIAGKALYQFEQLKKYADEVIIFFDEPILSAIGTDAYLSITDDDIVSGLNDVINTVKSKGALTGVHCCGNMNWGVLASTDIDIISFDAYFFGDKLAIYPDKMETFLNRNGILAWGIVPTNDTETLEDVTAEGLKKIIDGHIQLFSEKGISVERLKKQAIFTPSCGMGSLSIDDSEQVLKLLNGVAQLL